LSVPTVLSNQFEHSGQLTGPRFQFLLMSNQTRHLDRRDSQERGMQINQTQSDTPISLP